MFLPNLTPAVARALEAAQCWAGRLGATEVLPEHLLQGLLDEVEGRAAQLLTRAGLQIAAIRPQLEIPADATREVPLSLPLGALSERAFERARDLAALASAERTVASDHLLWAMLLEDLPLRCHLEQHGLATDYLAQAIQALQGPPLIPDEPLDLSATVEEMDTARILDASLNRAREALRVIEDYCRFALDDVLLTQECKRLRHGLAEAFADIAAGALLAARDTLGDVGTSLSTPAEGERTSLAGVVLANCKRLQESLRSLEEYGKLHGPELGATVEGFRYQSYTLERAILLGTTARKRLAHARLYLLVTGSMCTAAVDWTIQEAMAGGVQVVQLREKSLADRDLLERARLVRRLTRAAGVLFVINDRPDIARLVEADGVHLGQEDMPVKEARRLLGPEALIGVSTHDLDQVRRAVLDGASYIGVGPTFPSATKSFSEFPGLEFARRAVAITSLPAFVIGGVNQDNVEEVIAAGLKRVAVSQAICRADEPCEAAAGLRRVLDAV